MKTHGKKYEAAAKFAPKWGRLHLKWGQALAKQGKADAARAQEGEQSPDGDPKAR